MTPPAAKRWIRPCMAPAPTAISWIMPRKAMPVREERSAAHH